MQTFLPYASFRYSLLALDKRRCWKQAVEAKQIYNAITGVSKGWINHPCTKMWFNYPDALACYFNEALRISIENHKVKVKAFLPLPVVGNPQMPKWFGNSDFHYSHRCNLWRKALEDISKKNNYQLAAALEGSLIFLCKVDVTKPYIWPIDGR